MKNSIQLNSGKFFDFVDIESNVFDIYDIAHGLSNICRYNGQCKYFYSVAQHSVYVSWLVDEKRKKAALLHDGLEAYMHDITKPFKVLLPDYLEYEARGEKHFQSQFGTFMDEEIHLADMMMLKAEKQQIFECGESWTMLEGIPDCDIVIDPMLPEQAKEFFLNECKKLGLI